jgi:hypothetical protein
VRSGKYYETRQLQIEEARDKTEDGVTAPKPKLKKAK